MNLVKSIFLICCICKLDSTEYLANQESADIGLNATEIKQALTRIQDLEIEVLVINEVNSLREEVSRILSLFHRQYCADLIIQNDATDPLYIFKSYLESTMQIYAQPIEKDWLVLQLGDLHKKLKSLNSSFEYIFNHRETYISAATALFFNGAELLYVATDHGLSSIEDILPNELFKLLEFDAKIHKFSGQKQERIRQSLSEWNSSIEMKIIKEKSLHPQHIDNRILQRKKSISDTLYYIHTLQKHRLLRSEYQQDIPCVQAFINALTSRGLLCQEPTVLTPSTPKQPNKIKKKSSKKSKKKLVILDKNDFNDENAEDKENCKNSANNSPNTSVIIDHEYITAYLSTNISPKKDNQIIKIEEEPIVSRLNFETTDHNPESSENCSTEDETTSESSGENLSNSHLKNPNIAQEQDPLHFPEWMSKNDSETIGDILDTVGKRRIAADKVDALMQRLVKKQQAMQIRAEYITKKGGSHRVAKLMSKQNKPIIFPFAHHSGRDLDSNSRNMLVESFKKLVDHTSII